jgi:hypothetical protein
MIIPSRSYFVDTLCELSFGRDDLTPTHRFEEDHVGHDNLERFAELLDTCPEASRVSFHGWFQKKSAFSVPIHSLIQTFFPIRRRWLVEADRVCQEYGVDLDNDLILNIRGREYKHAWSGVNYVGVDWARSAVEAFGETVRSVFLVSDGDDVPVLADGRNVVHLSRAHDQFIDFAVMASARNVAIPKSSFSAVAVLATPKPKRVLYPDAWLVDELYAHQMVEMLDDAPFIEKVHLSGY